MTPAVGIISTGSYVPSAFMLAMTRKGLAEAEGLPILATFGAAECDTIPLENAAMPDRTYLGADSTLALLWAVVSRRPVSVEYKDPLTGERSACAITPASQLLRHVEA